MRRTTTSPQPVPRDAFLTIRISVNVPIMYALRNETRIGLALRELVFSLNVSTNRLV